MHLGLPPSAVLAWPFDDMMLVLALAQREGYPAQRIENAVARLATMTANMNRKKGAAAYSLKDFLPPDPWQPQQVLDPKSSRYSDLDREFLAALGGA